MKNKEFITGLVEGVVSMGVSVVALYAGMNLGLRARRKILLSQIEDRIDEEEAFEDDEAEL